MKWLKTTLIGCSFVMLLYSILPVHDSTLCCLQVPSSRFLRQLVSMLKYADKILSTILRGRTGLIAIFLNLLLGTHLLSEFSKPDPPLDAVAVTP